MNFNPITASKEIVQSYLRYMETTFYINDPDYRKQYVDSLHKSGFFSKGPYLDVTDSFESGKSLNDLIDEGIVSAEFCKLHSSALPVERPLYKHQEESIRLISAGKNAVITTGTGSGKTESFLLPILDFLFKENEKGILSPGVRALLIYPMNALANDQIKRMRELLGNYPDITFGTYTGETEEYDEYALNKYRKLNGSDPKLNELISRRQMKETPPHILITNYAMLEYLMIRPGDDVFFSGINSKHWRFVVLDEAHTYTGATGIEVAMLLRRLKARIDSGYPINYILTSATLGNSAKDNPDVISFASNLCSEDGFTDECIIRAKRVKIMPSDITEDYPVKMYSELKQYSDKESEQALFEKIKEYKRDIVKSDIHEMLFDLLITDSRYYKLKNLVSSKTFQATEVACELCLSDDELVDFISLASMARKNAVSLFDARYHFFIRSLEGAYLTLDPQKRLFVEPYKDFEGFKAFEFSVCRDCGQIYIKGQISAEDTETGRRYLNQPEKDNLYNFEFFMLNPNLDDDDEMYYVCAKCGCATRSTAINGNCCKCGKAYQNRLRQISNKKGRLYKCEVCGGKNSTNILRDFYMGQTAAASVVGTALYEALPSRKIVYTPKQQVNDEFDFGFSDDNDSEANEQKTECLTKQFLAFSDSRQEAAYFASYFDYTYHSILRRRVIVEALKTFRDDYKGGVSIRRLASDIESIFGKYDLFEKEDRKKEAFKTILRELILKDPISLESIGVICFENKCRMPELKIFQNGESAAVGGVLANTFRSSGCIYYDDMASLTDSDKVLLQYNGSNHEMVLDIAEKDDYSVSWMPKKQENARSDYLKRLTKQIEGESWPKEKIDNFLKLMWQKVFSPELKTDNNRGYRLRADSFIIHSNYSDDLKLYRCNKCGNITRYNADNVCPGYRCNGVLEKYDFSSAEKNHYYQLYCNLDIYDLKIREHTAQLGIEQAKTYQEEFTEKKINILSCSTTFEMGVDVGDLETVFMKNMPPTPSNYTQRAGRAGRRTDSAAYALTFCRLSSHDLNYFRTPEKMIKGHIAPPKFKIDNEKIVKRHIYACCLSEFFRSNRECFSDVKEFILNQDRLQRFKYMVRCRPNGLMKTIKRSTPEQLQGKIESWLDEIVSDDGILMRSYALLNREIDELEEALDGKIVKERFFEAGFIKRALNTMKSESILPFLSRGNIIPKYGFPVDSVELKTGINKGKISPLRLSRDLSMAVSEYAPGSEVIADGLIYRSRYICKPPGNNKEWQMYDFGVCENQECGNTYIKRFVSGDTSFVGICPVCNGPVKKHGTFLIPEYGFVADLKTEKATTKKPDKTYRGEISYIGNISSDTQTLIREITIGGSTVTFRSSTNDELLYLNKSPFSICPKCGYGKVMKGSSFTNDTEAAEEHRDSNGYICDNKTSTLKRYLGYKFRTDVVEISFGVMIEYETALSVLYAILEGLSRSLEIERNDIAGCIHHSTVNGTPVTSFIIFDNVPGGAGHTARVFNADEALIRNIFEQTFHVVADCTCGGAEGNSACYSCLCNYSNQFVHSKLKRAVLLLL